MSIVKVPGHRRCCLQLLKKEKRRSRDDQRDSREREGEKRANSHTTAAVRVPIWGAREVGRDTV